MAAPLVKYDPTKVTAFTPEEAATLSKSNEVLGSTSSNTSVSPVHPGFVVDPDYSSSFTGLTDAQLREIEDRKNALYAGDEQRLEEGRARNESRIGLGYDITEEQIIETRDEGFRQMRYAQERLGGSTVLKRNIEDFTANAKQFVGTIDRSLERLKLEEEVALETNNAQYLKGIQDIKIRALESEQNMVEQSLRLYQAYSAELTNRQNRAINEEENRRNRLDFYLDNDLLDGASQKDLNDVSAATGFTVEQIRQAQQFREEETAAARSKAGGVDDRGEYDLARSIVAENPNMSRAEVYARILEKTKHLTSTEINAVLDTVEITLSEEDMTDILDGLLAEFGDSRGGKNKALEHIAENSIDVGGWEYNLSREEIAAIKERMRTGAEKFFPGGD